MLPSTEQMLSILGMPMRMNLTRLEVVVGSKGYSSEVGCTPTKYSPLFVLAFLRKSQAAIVMVGMPSTTVILVPHIMQRPVCFHESLRAGSTSSSLTMNVLCRSTYLQVDGNWHCHLGLDITNRKVWWKFCNCCRCHATVALPNAS